MEKEDQVLETGQQGVSQETPNAGGVSQQTPAQVSQDAEWQEKQAKFEAELKKYQEDINNVKSTFQKREAELLRDARTREEKLAEELRQTKMLTLDDEGRKKYEQELVQEKLRSFETEKQKLQREAEERSAMLDNYDYFLKMGVPPSVLNRENHDALVKSGWDFITGRLKELEALQQNSGQQKTSNTQQSLRQAPPVVTGNGVSSGYKPTWEDLEKKYGSRESVYTLIEQGRLDPSVLP